MKRRLLYGTAGLVAVLLAASWALQRSDWLSGRLRAPIEAGLAKATGRSVSLGGVGGGLSGWLWLHDVSMGPSAEARAVDVSFTAEAVGLKLDAWALLKGQADLSSLKAVQVRSPRLYFLRRDLPQAASPSAGAFDDWQAKLQGLPLPPVRFELRNGEAWDQLAGQAVVKVAKGLRLGLDPDKKGAWRLQGHADLERGGLLDVWGRSEAGWKGLQLRLRGRALSLAGFGAGPWSIQGGTLSGDLEAKPQAGAWPAGVALKGQGGVEALALNAVGKPGLQDLNARWRFDQGRLDLSELSALALGGRLKGKGSLELPAQKLQLNASVKQLDLAALAAFSGAPVGLGLSGKGDLDLGAVGPLSATVATVTLRSRGARWQGHLLDRADLRGQLAGEALRAEGELAWEGGQGELELAAQGGKVTLATFKAQALPADWLQAWAGSGIEGRLDGEGRYRQQANGQTPWEASVRSAQLKAREFHITGLALQAGGDAKSARVRVEGGLPNWPGLNASGEAQAAAGGLWNLKNLKVFQQERLLMQAGGAWRPAAAGRAATLRLDLKSGAVNVAALPAWPLLAGLSGTAQAEGAVDLDGAGWRGELKLSAPGLLRGHIPLGLKAALRFAPGSISVTALELRQGELRGTASAAAWSGPWRGDLALNGAWLPALGAPQGVSGRADGTLRFNSTGDELHAALDLADPLPAVLPRAKARLELDVLGGRWDLRKLELQQDRGSLSAGASWDSGGRGIFKGEAHWEGLQLEGVPSSGQASLSGGGGAPGRLSVDPWSLSGTALPLLEADLLFMDGGFAGVAARWGSATRLKAQRGPHGWDLRADLQGQDPGPLLGPWVGRPAVTPLRLSGWMEAKALGSSGTAKVSAELREDAAVASGFKAAGEWRAGGFDGSAEWKGIELERLQQGLGALGISLPPMQGRLAGELHSSAAGLSLSAKAAGFFWDGLDLATGTLRASKKDGRWELHELRAGGNGPRVHLEHGLWQATPKGYKASADLSLELWPLAIFDVSGKGALQASGEAGKTAWDAKWKELKIGERMWKGVGLEGSWEGGRWALRESGKRPGVRAQGLAKGGVFEISDLQAESGKGRGWVKGKVGAKSELDWEASATGFPASDITGVLGWTQVWTGAAYGSVKVSGRVGQAQSVISVKIEDGSVEGLPFDLATALVHQDGDWIDLAPVQPIRLSRKGGVALEVGGKVPLGDGKSAPSGLDVWAELKQGGLGLFAGMPGIRLAEGPLELSLRFKGRRDDPQVSGRLRVADGKVTPAWLLPPLERLDVFAQLEDGQVLLQQSQARVAGGGPLLKLELVDPKRPAFTLERWVPANFNLRLRASKSGLPVKSTPQLRFMDATLLPELTLAGSWDVPELSGELVVTKGEQDKAVITWPARFDPPNKEGEKGFTDRVRFDLRIIARQDVLVRTEAAQVFIDTGEQGLRLSGSGEERLLEGRLVFNRGSVDYLLASFNLASDKETKVDFRGSDAPDLDLWGVKKVRNVYLNGEALARDVEVTLHAFGPLGAVEVALESDAKGANGEDLKNEQLISLAGLGVDVSDPRSQGGFLRILGKVPAGMLTRWFRNKGLIDEVGLRLPFVEDAMAGGARQTPGPLDTGPSYQPTPVTGSARALVDVHVGKYLGEKLFFGVNGQIIERTDAQGANSRDAAVGGEMEYELKNKAKLKAQHNVDTSGQTEQRVTLEQSSHFANYNPRKRRWDGIATPTPTPSPALK